MEEQLLIGRWHVTLATWCKQRLLQKRELLASLIEGRLLRRKLFLLNGNQCVFLGDERSQFLGAVLQSVQALKEFVAGGGTSVIHAR
jgi:hypothetical protein